MDAAPYRQACDRCHRQKLRCIRDSDYSGGACIRCFKAQVRCVSSPSLRLRRGEGRNSQSDNTKGSTRKVTPEHVPEECLPSSVALDEDTLQSPNFLEHDPSNQGTTGQTVPDMDINLFNFSWTPNAPIGEATLGMTGLPRGQDGGGLPFGNNFGNNNMEVSNIHPSPVSNIRPSPPMTLPLTGEASLKPSNLTQAPRNEAWIHSLTQINVDLYLQHSILERNLTSQRDVDSGVGDLSRNKTPGATSVEGTNQFCIGHTFDLIHRLLRLLDEVSSNTRARLDRASILLVLSCYHRLVEIYGSFFRSPNLGQASPPELSTHMKHSPFLMGQFELYTNSPLYTPLVVSLADFMLLKCRDAVNKINTLSEQKELDNDHLRIMGDGGVNVQETTRGKVADALLRRL